MKSGIRYLLLSGLLTTTLAYPLSAVIGYTESYGDLFTTELESGAATLVGPTLAGVNFQALDIDPDGVLWGISRNYSGPDGLFVLDPSTGQASRFGDPGEENLESRQDRTSRA